MKTLIVFATPMENKVTPGSSDHYETLVTGAGKLNAAMGLLKWLSESSCDQIINLGICGSVSERFQVMDIVRVSKFIEGDREHIPGEQKQIIETNEHPMLKFESAILVTNDHSITTPDSQKRMQALSGEIVDMEGYAYAKVAIQAGIPFQSCKIISDLADNSTHQDIKKIIHRASTKLCETVIQRINP